MRYFFNVLLAGLLLRLSLGACVGNASKSHLHDQHGKKHADHHIAKQTGSSLVLHGQKVLPSRGAHLLAKTKTVDMKSSMRRSGLQVTGPLPADFMDRFAKEVAKVTGCKPDDVRIFNMSSVNGHSGVDEIVWEAPPDVVAVVEEQARDPNSELAKGPLGLFLTGKDGQRDAAKTDAADIGTVHTRYSQSVVDSRAKKTANAKNKEEEKEESEASNCEEEDEEEDEEEQGGRSVQEKGIDVDTEMPYGEMEPFGREDTAQELTRASIQESDSMVDQIERAEVAEEKRAVFRALTRLRGAAISSFDGVARSQTGNIDTYARDNHWRSTHPVRHLANEESDVEKWAFPHGLGF